MAKERTGRTAANDGSVKPAHWLLALLLGATLVSGTTARVQQDQVFKLFVESCTDEVVGWKCKTQAQRLPSDKVTLEPMDAIVRAGNEHGFACPEGYILNSLKILPSNDSTIRYQPTCIALDGEKNVQLGQVQYPRRVFNESNEGVQHGCKEGQGLQSIWYPGYPQNFFFEASCVDNAASKRSSSAEPLGACYTKVFEASNFPPWHTWQWVWKPPHPFFDWPINLIVESASHYFGNDWSINMWCEPTEFLNNWWWKSDSRYMHGEEWEYLFNIEYQCCTSSKHSEVTLHNIRDLSTDTVSYKFKHVKAEFTRGKQRTFYLNETVYFFEFYLYGKNFIDMSEAIVKHSEGDANRMCLDCLVDRDVHKGTWLGTGGNHGQGTGVLTFEFAEPVEFDSHGFTYDGGRRAGTPFNYVGGGAIIDAFKLFGSHDGSNWKLLHKVAGLEHPEKFGAGEPYTTFTFALPQDPSEEMTRLDKPAIEVQPQTDAITVIADRYYLFATTLPLGLSNTVLEFETWTPNYDDPFYCLVGLYSTDCFAYQGPGQLPQRLSTPIYELLKNDINNGVISTEYLVEVFRQVVRYSLQQMAQQVRRLFRGEDAQSSIFTIRSLARFLGDARRTVEQALLPFESVKSHADLLSRYLFMGKFEGDFVPKLLDSLDFLRPILKSAVPSDGNAFDVPATSLALFVDRSGGGNGELDVFLSSLIQRMRNIGTASALYSETKQIQLNDAKTRLQELDINIAIVSGQLEASQNLAKLIQGAFDVMANMNKDMLSGLDKWQAGTKALIVDVEEAKAQGKEIEASLSKEQALQRVVLQCENLKMIRGRVLERKTSLDEAEEEYEKAAKAYIEAKKKELDRKRAKGVLSFLGGITKIITGAVKGEVDTVIHGIGSIAGTTIDTLEAVSLNNDIQSQEKALQNSAKAASLFQESYFTGEDGFFSIVQQLGLEDTIGDACEDVSLGRDAVPDAWIDSLDEQLGSGVDDVRKDLLAFSPVMANDMKVTFSQLLLSGTTGPASGSGLQGAASNLQLEVSALLDLIAASFEGIGGLLNEVENLKLFAVTANAAKNVQDILQQYSSTDDGVLNEFLQTYSRREEEIANLEEDVRRSSEMAEDKALELAQKLRNNLEALIENVEADLSRVDMEISSLLFNWLTELRKVLTDTCRAYKYAVPDDEQVDFTSSLKVPKEDTLCSVALIDDFSWLMNEEVLNIDHNARRKLAKALDFLEKEFQPRLKKMKEVLQFQNANPDDTNIKSTLIHLVDTSKFQMSTCALPINVTRVLECSYGFASRGSVEASQEQKDTSRDPELYFGPSCDRIEEYCNQEQPDSIQELFDLEEPERCFCACSWNDDVTEACRSNQLRDFVAEQCRTLVEPFVGFIAEPSCVGVDFAPFRDSGGQVPLEIDLSGTFHLVHPFSSDFFMVGYNFILEGAKSETRGMPGTLELQFDQTMYQANSRRTQAKEELIKFNAEPLSKLYKWTDTYVPPEQPFVCPASYMNEACYCSSRYPTTDFGCKYCQCRNSMTDKPLDVLLAPPTPLNKFKIYSRGFDLSNVGTAAFRIKFTSRFGTLSNSVKTMVHFTVHGDSNAQGLKIRQSTLEARNDAIECKKLEERLRLAFQKLLRQSPSLAAGTFLLPSSVDPTSTLVSSRDTIVVCKPDGLGSYNISLSLFSAQNFAQAISAFKRDMDPSRFKSYMNGILMDDTNSTSRPSLDDYSVEVLDNAGFGETTGNLYMQEEQESVDDPVDDPSDPSPPPGPEDEPDSGPVAEPDPGPVAEPDTEPVAEPTTGTPESSVSRCIASICIAFLVGQLAFII